MSKRDILEGAAVVAGSVVFGAVLAALGALVLG